MIRSEKGIEAIPNSSSNAAADGSNSSSSSSDITFSVGGGSGLTVRVTWFASNQYQSLHCKVQPDPSMMGHWQQDPKMLQVGLLETQVHQNETNLDFLSDS